MPTPLARLVFPALRWRSRTGFTHERRRIAAALSAGVGGFIVFGGTREAITALTNALHEQAGRPLLLGADLERGASQQVQGLTDIPPAGALGFLNDLDATYAASMITGVEAAAVGFNWNFAPVCDLDTEALNPIVQTRSFGSQPVHVGAHAAASVRGLQEHSVLACAKHYPGHGRTTVDSHEALPVVTASMEEVRTVDGAPFRQAIGAGVGSVMTAHVAYPNWAGDRAATFAPEILGYLRDDLAFDGLVVTDALIMGGARAAQDEAAAAVAAVAAGCDALLYPENFRAVIAALDAALGSTIPAGRADEALARYEAALRTWGQKEPRGATDIDVAAHQVFADALADRAIHLVRGERPLLSATAEITVVDDDAGGRYPIASRAVFAATMRAADPGVRPATLGPGGASRIVALYSEPRSWKGRADLGTAARGALATLTTAELIVLFGHPRLADSIPPGPPVLCAWHGQALMQRAAARWILRD